MSDALTNPQDFLGDDADEELVFDDPEAVAAAAPSTSDAKTPKPRRPRRAQAHVMEDVVIEEPRSDMPMPLPSVAVPAATTEEPAGVPAPFPPQSVAPAGSKTQSWLILIVVLALLSSFLSLGGLIAVSRTLADANAQRQEANAEREVLARVPGLVANLDHASERLDAAAAKLLNAAPGGPPATIPDIRHELDALKLALAGHEPEGIASLGGATREGFSEITTKLDRLSDRLDKMEASGGAVSASRPASPAAYPKRPS